MELCEYFKPGDHVKVVSGVQEGATGMVVKVEGHVLIILSDTSKEDVSDEIDRVLHMQWFGNILASLLCRFEFSQIMLWRVLKLLQESLELGIMSCMILCCWSKF